MFIPIGDSPNPRNFRPWVTHGLIVVNVTVFLLLWSQAFRRADPRDPAFSDYLQTIARENEISGGQLAQVEQGLSEYDLTVYRHGFRPAQPQLADALAAMFLHGGLAHLLGNMLFLWIYGDNLEHKLGRGRYLSFYLLTGLAATGGDALLRLGSSVPSVGASGAISGVLGGYFVLFPHNRVRVWMWWLPIMELPARFVLGFYIVVQNLLPMMFAEGAGGVSHGAHVGGFFAGAAGVWFLERWHGQRSYRSMVDPVGVRPSVTADVASDFTTALDAGRLAEATQLLFAAPARNGIAADDKVRLGEQLAKDGHARAALAVCQLVLRAHPRTPAATTAQLIAARVLFSTLREPIAAFQHVRSVLATPNLTAAQRDDAHVLLAELSTATASMPRLH